MKTLHIILTGLFLTAFSFAVHSQCTNCQDATITGVNASGLGTSPTATGHSSLAGGHTSLASGAYSFAFGYESKAIGSSSIAFGSMVEAKTTSSVVIGQFLKSTATGGFLLGAGYAWNNPMINNSANTLMIGFNSQYPTFFVSSSIGSTSTGKIGIGNVTNPTAKLHLLADEHEAAEIKLEHRSTGIRQYAQVLLGTHSIRAGDAENMVFTTPDSRNFAFVNGNVGIGSSDPVAKFQVKDGDIFIEDIDRGIIMKSPDGNCWRGVLNNMGQLEFVLLPDCLGTTTSVEGIDYKPGFNIVPNPASGNLQIQCTAEELHNYTAYKMLDSSGKEVKEGTLNNTATQLDIQNLSSGIYFLNFYGKGAYWTEKVVVK